MPAELGIGYVPSANRPVGGVYVDEYIYHKGDVDTYFRFEDDKLTVVVGGVSALIIEEAASDSITWGAYNHTFGGDVNIGANLLKTTNLIIKELDSNSIGIRNSADNAYRNLYANTIVYAEQIIAGADALSINSPNTDANYTTFKARDSDVGLVEVGRLAGAADPYFSMGGSREFKFTNGGLMGLYGVTAVARSAGWTITNDQTDRAFDADTVAVAELADVVATLITDLAATGIIGASA